MHLGIKIGPGNWLDKLDNELAIQRAEVYLNLARPDEYPTMFAWLRDRGIQAGLHLSTLLPGNVFPNLATTDTEVRQASVDLLHRTLDLAGEQGMRFLVFHPGSYRNMYVASGNVYLFGPETAPQEGEARVVEETLRLLAYACERGVDLWPENLPGRECAGYEPEERERTVDPGFLPWTALRMLGEAGAGLCVDVGHIYAEVMSSAWDPSRPSTPAGYGSPDVDAFDAQVLAVTRELAPYARHLHVSTIMPPWNGADGHDGFLDTDYAQGALPAADQLLSWLNLFDSREAWIIPEPAGGTEVHLANHMRLRTLLSASLAAPEGEGAEVPADGRGHARQEQSQ